MNLSRIQEELETRSFGKTIFFQQKIGSTNEWAKKLAKLGASEGTVAIAKTQTSAKGRLCRKWISPAGGLWLSIILRPKLPAKEAAKLVFVSALAVVETFNELYGLRANTKWPNDVLIEGRKVCGILCEMNANDRATDFVIVGIGINANFDARKKLPKDLKTDAVSLRTALGRKIILEELLVALLAKFETLYQTFLKEGFNKILKEWKKHAGFLGCTVEVADQAKKLRGTAQDVDSEGALVLKTKEGTARVFVGDMSMSKTATS
ncbi:MAG: biotin--[acetyl-CoA-carboxylase] ligase [Candidatus Bathyarchaeia archaeon]